MSSLSIGGLVARFAGNLRYPKLVMITALILLVDLVVPDPLPFVEEILLALMTLIFVSFKERKDTKGGTEVAAESSGEAVSTDTPEKREATVISVEPNPNP